MTAKIAPELEITVQDLGKVVSYNYVNVTAKGTPLRPYVYRFRPDLTWTDAIANYSTPRPAIYGIYHYVTITQTKLMCFQTNHLQRHELTEKRTSLNLILPKQPLVLLPPFQKRTRTTSMIALKSTPHPLIH